MFQQCAITSAYFYFNSVQPLSLIFTLLLFHLKNKTPEISGSSELYSKLIWSAHINHLKFKLSSLIYMVNQIKRVEGEDSALLIHPAFCLMHLVQTHVMGWNPHENINKMFALQKIAVHGIQHVHFLKHWNQFFIQINIAYY